MSSLVWFPRQEPPPEATIHNIDNQREVMGRRWLLIISFRKITLMGAGIIRQRRRHLATTFHRESVNPASPGCTRPQGQTTPNLCLPRRPSTTPPRRVPTWHPGHRSTATTCHHPTIYQTSPDICDTMAVCFKRFVMHCFVFVLLL